MTRVAPSMLKIANGKDPACNEKLQIKHSTSIKCHPRHNNQGKETICSKGCLKSDVLAATKS